MLKSKETNLVSRIRALQRLDKANKQCADCGELGPVYICTDFHTFVCTECSGLHRELSHKVKSITMSNWSKDEVEALERSGGNTRDKEVYLGAYDPKAYPLPTSGNREKLREFIRMKYTDKRWVGKAPSQVPASRSTVPVSEHLLQGDSSPESRSSRSGKAKQLSTGESQWPVSTDGISHEVSRGQNINTQSSDDITHRFKKCLHRLSELQDTDPQSANQIAQSMIESLEKFVIKASPTVVHSNPITPQSSTNPFDFLTTPTMVVGTPVAPTLNAASTNPFDFLS
jgi:hypothetical protein